jgi:hypothetical protein
MNFGEALSGMEQGLKAERAGWNGKGMFVFKGYPRCEVESNKEGCGLVDAAKLYDVNYSGAVICMMTASKTIVVGWLASQTDMMANDWNVF